MIVSRECLDCGEPFVCTKTRIQNLCVRCEKGDFEMFKSEKYKIPTDVDCKCSGCIACNDSCKKQFKRRLGRTAFGVLVCIECYRAKFHTRQSSSIDL